STDGGRVDQPYPALLWHLGALPAGLVHPYQTEHGHLAVRGGRCGGGHRLAAGHLTESAVHQHHGAVLGPDGGDDLVAAGIAIGTEADHVLLVGEVVAGDADPVPLI